jgi:hypothetical protein
VAHEQQRRASILGLRGTLGGNDGQTSAGGTPFYMAPEIVGALLANQVLSATANDHGASPLIVQAHGACHGVSSQHGQVPTAALYVCDVDEGTELLHDACTAATSANSSLGCVGTGGHLVGGYIPQPPFLHNSEGMVAGDHPLSSKLSHGCCGPHFIKAGSTNQSCMLPADMLP